MKKENGITLMSLVITVIVLILIAGISIKSGTESVDDTRLEAFYTELEVIQKRVDEIASTNENYIDNNGNKIYLKDVGTNLNDEQTNLLTSINSNYVPSNFKYFTANQLKNIFGLSDISQDVFINFSDRTVISANGIEINKKKYYTLKNTSYFVEHTEKNKGVIDSLKYNATLYGTNKYKVKITPSNTIGDITEDGIIKYKKSNSKYWETTNNLEIIIEQNIEYDIIYQDKNNNTVTKKIIVKLDDNTNQPVVSEL